MAEKNQNVNAAEQVAGPATSTVPGEVGPVTPAPATSTVPGDVDTVTPAPANSTAPAQVDQVGRAATVEDAADEASDGNTPEVEMDDILHQEEEALLSGRPAAVRPSRQWRAAGAAPDNGPPKPAKVSDAIVKKRATIQKKAQLNKRQKQVEKALVKLEAKIEKEKAVNEEAARRNEETARRNEETARRNAESERMMVGRHQLEQQRMQLREANLSRREEWLQYQAQMLQRHLIAQSGINTAHQEYNQATAQHLEQFFQLLKEASRTIAALDDLREAMIGGWLPEYMWRTREAGRHESMGGQGAPVDLYHQQAASHQRAQAGRIHTWALEELHRLREGRRHLMLAQPDWTVEGINNGYEMVRQAHAATTMALRQAITEADNQHNQDFMGRSDLEIAGINQDRPDVLTLAVPDALQPLTVSFLTEEYPGMRAIEAAPEDTNNGSNI
ncbi:MAG: hypothetical protein LQ338_006974 [Usnochroma carphineum]|nr:MAG: hypothetical protein LQ338_006974 [Usnochroma carphineum]